MDNSRNDSLVSFESTYEKSSKIEENLLENST